MTRSALATLRLRELRQMAVRMGATAAEIDEAEDADDIRNALVKLVRRPEAQVVSGYRQDLSKLQRRMATSVADKSAIEITEGTARSKSSMLELATADEKHNSVKNLGAAIVHHGANGDQILRRNSTLHRKRLAALDAELQPMRVSALQRRAVSDGVEASAVDAAVDAENAKEELIKLILAQCVQEPDVVDGASVEQVKHSKSDAFVGREHKSHLGSGAKARASLQEADEQPNPARLQHCVIPNGLHAMLSYQWCAHVASCHSYFSFTRS